MLTCKAAGGNAESTEPEQSLTRVRDPGERLLRLRTFR
jgi:hypothetical protein